MDITLNRTKDIPMKLAVSTTLALFSIIFYGCALSKDIYSLDNRLVALEKRNIALESQNLGQNQSSLELKKLILKLENRILKLEKQNLKLEKQNLKLEKQNLVSKKELALIKSSAEDSNKAHKEKEQNLRNQSAELHVILEGLREEIQLINGKFEETDYVLEQKIKVFEDVDKEKNSQLNQLVNRLNELGKRLDKLENSIDSNKDIIAHLEQYLKFESSEKIDLKIKKDTEAEKEYSEKELYLLAKMAFDQGDFETAREEFGKFLTKYPKSERADNAQYWIGEIYYREKWYEKAILEYQKVIENYPKGNKVPDSLLKQGFAFNNINDKINARLVFKELIEKYPKSEQTKVAKEKSKEVGL